MQGLYGLGLVALLGFQHLAGATDPPPRPVFSKEAFKKAENDIIPGRFIVEFSDVNALTKRSVNGDVSFRTLSHIYTTFTPWVLPLSCLNTSCMQLYALAIFTDALNQ